MDLQVGSTVGDYQVMNVLGAGGMGKVYQVRNVISDRIEAMKVLLPDLGNAPELADRFLREIKVQASLEHPNIAALHTALRVDNQLLMLMEFVEGVTLDHKLKDGPLPVGAAVDYMRQVLSALEYAHARGVIHRDIKPANMMLTPAGAVKLMDFGIAKAATDHRLTMTGTTLGSLYYMSPEQIQGTAAIDARSDLYSAGVSLYELVTAKRPFDGTSQFEIMSAHLNNTPIAPVEVDPRLPQALNDIILMSVEKSPDARFQTAGAFRNALGNVVPAQAAPRPITTVASAAAAAPTRAPATPAEPVAAQPVRSRRGLWMGIGAVVMAAVVIALIQFGPWHGTKAAPAITPPKSIVETPAPAPQPAPAPVEATTPAPTPAPVVVPAPAPKATPTPAKPVRAQATPVQAAPAQVTPAPQPPPAQAAAPPPQAVAAPTPAPAPAGPSRAELQQAREQLVDLNARVTGIHASLSSLQRSQAASGLNLRGDMQTAANLMDSYMQGANAALNAGDVASAKSFMDKAELQVERLEKFLNR
ncbi:MAG TPA: serine/threonine-protein kinase [Bryobacteraceae bacterium]|nr:serine/threonine-protein kinase [Bryobacteraceae bacterium]